MNAGALFTVGYSGDYGNQIQSNHGLTFGATGTVSGYYYNPNFINFNVTPYYNQSKADSDYQSLTNASGVAATANFFTGSHFPGSVSYRYDYNSTGTLGLSGTPNFTTQGNGQGFGVNWSALFPDGLRCRSGTSKEAAAVLCTAPIRKPHPTAPVQCAVRTGWRIST